MIEFLLGVYVMGVIMHAIGVTWEGKNGKEVEKWQAVGIAIIWPAMWLGLAHEWVYNLMVKKWKEIRNETN